MSAHESHPADPRQEALAGYGRSIILVPLIIGGALIVATILMWHAHNKRARIADATQVEEQVREELRAAHAEMRALRPAQALQRSDTAKKLMAKLPVVLAPDYADLKVVQLLVEGESLFMLDCAAHAEAAEERFDQAMNLMNYASGEMWLFGMLGRARARYESKCYELALQDLNAIMDRNNSFGAAFYWRSLTRAALGDVRGAQADERRARALDSWPPLRDFMQSSCRRTRDVLSKPVMPETGETRGDLVEIYATEAADAAAVSSFAE
ncbi:MAG: hypothetical protein LUE17_12505 [Planctomycetaceae bacterium]|nr:hypothetical protein [Planctomycetaceae bacterium]